MTTTPDITVITPVIGRDAHFLPRVYQSLIRQVGVSWEWIVSEDGDSGEVARYLPTDRRVRFINAPDSGGPASARNYALGQARTFGVRNLDSDDRLAHPDALAESSRSLVENHYSVSPAIDVYPDGEMKEFKLDVPFGRINPGDLMKTWEDSGSGPLPVHPTTLAVRTDTALSLGGWGGLRYGEDTLLLMRLDALFGGWLLERPGTLYAKRPDQITAQPYNTDPEDKRLYTDFIQRSARLTVGLNS